MNNDLMFTSQNQCWDTEQDFYDELNETFDFDLDPCCTLDNCKCHRGLYSDQGFDGLNLPWHGRVFMNHPYDKTNLWIPKAYNETQKCRASSVIVLMPARTDTLTFHKYIYRKPLVRYIFLKGRLTFGSQKYWEWVWEQPEFKVTQKDGTIKTKKNSLYKKYGKKNPAPFPSMLVYFKTPYFQDFQLWQNFTKLRFKKH